MFTHRQSYNTLLAARQHGGMRMFQRGPPGLSIQWTTTLLQATKADHKWLLQHFDYTQDVSAIHIRQGAVVRNLHAVLRHHGKVIHKVQLQLTVYLVQSRTAAVALLAHLQ
jgi:hypothetical protein